MKVQVVDGRVARVFPSRTEATPTDQLAFVGDPPMLFPPDVDEVHISVTFGWNLKEAERLAYQWEKLGQVKIGGPATGMRGEEFVPGRYLQQGYVITSRGCPNRCWFCEVPKREGPIRELPIVEGCNILDDNLLACSETHIRAVFEMLRHQRYGRPRLTGGLEAARFRPWHVEEIARLRPELLYFAYDEPGDWEPLVEAVRMLRETDLPRRKHWLRAYVLVGHPHDRLQEAEKRLTKVARLGVMPMAMLHRPPTPVSYEAPREWRQLQREWARPVIIGQKMRELSA